MDNTLLFLLAVFILALVAVAFMSFGAKRPSRLNQAWFAQQWASIEAQFKDGKAGQQLAVVNADKLLDKAMRDLRYKGNTMGERLKSHSKNFKNINAIWSAHKLRNRIAHESNISVSAEEVKRALHDLKNGLKDIGAL
ncbi:MAG TPA: hypothetical protein VFZ58_03380 [Candidatus Saccharimonadales bacterium]